MRLVAVLLLDVLIAIGFLVLVGIALTGGGTIAIGSAHLSLRSVGNGLAAVYLLMFTRVITARNVPFLAGLTGSPSALSERAVLVIAAVSNWLRSPRSTGWLCAVFAVGVVLRLGNAAMHPGFFSGDDAEIHEMTLARLHGVPANVWDLRSPLYPLGFVFPVQFVASQLGATDPAALVLAGRSVVALASPFVMLLVYRIARSQLGYEAATLATLITATSALLVTFGSTELPRPISTLFIVSAYVLLAHDRPSRVIIAGAALAVGVAMRFSEGVFILPALMQLAIDRRFRSALLLGLSTLVVALGIQATVDYLYWGRPFASALAAIDYTLIQGQSSRGYQPVWHYFRHITDWTDYLVFGLAAYGVSVRTWRLTAWAGIPLLVLSLLPHKEPRYLIPVVPFVALLAASGLERLIARILSPAWPRRTAAAGLLVAAATGSLIYQASGMHVRRSDGAVRLAQAIRAGGALRPTDIMLIEAPWEFGGRVYLGFDTPIVEANTERLTSVNGLNAEVGESRASWIVLRAATCQRLDCQRLLAQSGFTPFAEPHRERSSGYIAMRRSPAPTSRD